MAVDFEEAFPTLLAAQEPVANVAGDRFFINRVPQREELPAVIVRRISGGPIRTLGGQCSVRRAMYQLESWSAKSQEEARALDRAVQEIECGGVLVGDWWVQRLTVNADTDQDNPQIPVHADDLGLFCSFSEVTVFYKPGV
jgi:hypothetical protein